MNPKSQIILASQGTLSNPQAGFIQSELESLFLWHAELKIKIYAEQIALRAVYDECSFCKVN